MSQLHPNEDDDAFDAGHADAGLKQALARLNELACLLEEARDYVPTELRTKIDKSLAREYRDPFYSAATRRPHQWERRRNMLPGRKRRVGDVWEKQGFRYRITGFGSLGDVFVVSTDRDSSKILQSNMQSINGWRLVSEGTGEEEPS